MTRVLIAYDVPGWAWERRARGLQRYATRGIDVCVCPVAELPTAARRLTPDAVLCLDLPSAPQLPDQARYWTFVANEGIRYHYGPDSLDLRQRCASRAKNADEARARLPAFHGVLTVNHRTLDFLRSCCPRVVYLRTGVDAASFRPLQPIRQEARLRVGWCGKRVPGRWTPKGYDEVLQPLMARLADAPIEWLVNDRDYRDALSTAQMVDWYNGLDLLLVTSCSEGTPSVLLEAMACGRGFVSTDVGLASEASRLGQAGLVVPAYHRAEAAPAVVAMLEQELRGLLADRDRVTYMGAAARRQIEEHYHWEQLAPRWLNVLLHDTDDPTDGPPAAA